MNNLTLATSLEAMIMEAGGNLGTTTGVLTVAEVTIMATTGADLATVQDSIIQTTIILGVVVLLRPWGGGQNYGEGYGSSWSNGPRGGGYGGAAPRQDAYSMGGNGLNGPPRSDRYGSNNNNNYYNNSGRGYN